MGWVKRAAVFITKNKPYFVLAIIILVSYVLFQSAYLFEADFHSIVDIAQYLTWHNLFEFALVSDMCKEQAR